MDQETMDRLRDEILSRIGGGDAQRSPDEGNVVFTTILGHPIALTIDPM